MINNDMTEQDTDNMKTDSIEKKPDELGGFHIEGHIKIHDPDSGDVYVNKRNAIHYENISEALAYNLANKGQSYIYEMHFGNGGTTVNATGVITYNPANTNAQNSSLYNATYSKIVDDTDVNNLDATRNKMEIRHTPGQPYTDILVTCLLDYGEPNDQAAFDNLQDLNGDYVFDELGLKTWNGSADDLKLITHVIFHPVQKSLNRQIQIDYTVRIQTLTNLSST